MIKKRSPASSKKNAREKIGGSLQVAMPARELHMELQHLHLDPFISTGSNSLDRIKELCQQQIYKLGYDYFNYTAYFPVCEERHEISSFPDEWSFVGNSEEFARNNPILASGQNRTTPFLWEAILSEEKGNKDQLVLFLRKADQHNIHDGLCIPVHGAGSEWGMLNVARNGSKLTDMPDTKQILQLFASTVHEAVKRANAYHIKERAREKTLSPRERECLDWIAAGKTAWETAQIVGITESTVAFHIRNTIIKLNASNRAHAVAVAMARSLIHNPHSKGHY